MVDLSIAMLNYQRVYPLLFYIPLFVVASEFFLAQDGGDHRGLAFGVSAMQGWREGMEV